MVNLVPIINSTETISSDAAPSLNAAFTELHQLFGFWPVVFSPYGGARTKAECLQEGLSWEISDHYEGAIGRAAVDIDNQRTFRNIDQKLFIDTLEKHGWHNMTTEGKDFPREPWHFANHSIVPASSNEKPLPNNPDTQNSREAKMKIHYIVDGDGKYGAKGVQYAMLVAENWRSPIYSGLSQINAAFSGLWNVYGDVAATGVPNGAGINSTYVAWELFLKLPILGA